MNRTSKGSSYLSGVLGFLRGKPQKIKTSTARKASARVQSKRKQGSGTAEHPYRAAEIVCQSHSACAAAMALSEKRFLLHEVPRIPLADCTSTKCACTYVRHQDRRRWSESRRAQFSVFTKLYATIGNADRRRKFGRRNDDGAAAAEFDFSKWDD